MNDSRKKTSIFEYYNLLLSREALNSFKLKYESETDRSELFRRSVETLFNNDRNLDFKNFYKQFSIEEEQENENDKPENKKEAENKKKKLLETVKNKSKDFYAKIMKFISNGIVSIAGKRIREKMEETLKTLESGKNLEGLNEDMKPAAFLSITNLSLWMLKVTYKMILANCDNYNQLNDDNELAACSNTLKDYAKNFEEFSKKLETLRSKKTFDEISVSFKELRNILKDFKSDGASEKALGEARDLMNDVENIVGANEDMCRNQGDAGRYKEFVDNILKESKDKTILPMEGDVIKILDQKLKGIVMSNAEGVKNNLSVNLTQFVWSFSKALQLVVNYSLQFTVSVRRVVKTKEKADIKKDKAGLKGKNDEEKINKEQKKPSTN